MKNIILILILLAVPISSFAISSSEEDRYVYLFHLYYDNGQLFADRDFEIKYDILAEEFVPETLNTPFPYKAEIITFSGQVASTFQFDPKQNNPGFLKGKISIKAPYVSDGQKAVFFDNNGNLLLTIFISESSFCNDDGVCNSDRGENEKTCPLDCKKATPVPTVPVETPESGQGGIWKSLIYVLIGGGILGGWYGWKWYKRRQEPPVYQFPQNPNVQ